MAEQYEQKRKPIHRGRLCDSLNDLGKLKLRVQLREKLSLVVTGYHHPTMVTQILKGLINEKKKQHLRGRYWGEF